MTATLDPAIALGVATTRDLVRRPAFALGVIALVSLLGPLPRLGSPAASAADNAALAVELTLASVGIAAALAAGAAGVRASGEADGQSAPELRSTPCATAALALGKVAGITAAIGAFVVVVLGGTASLWMLVGPFPEIRDPAAALVSVLGTWLTTLFFAALGLAVGACAERWLAHVLVVGLLVATRAFPPPASGPWSAVDLAASAVVPTARLDVARDAAFGRAVSLPSFGLAAMAGLCAAAAALLIASRRIEHREGS